MNNEDPYSLTRFVDLCSLVVLLVQDCIVVDMAC